MTRNRYKENTFKTNYGQFSFITISTKLLDLGFIVKHFEEDSLSTFKRFLKDRFNLIDLFYKSEKFWT